MTNRFRLLACPTGHWELEFVVAMPTSIDGDDFRATFRVRCMSCGWEGPIKPTPGEAVEAWNDQDISYQKREFAFRLEKGQSLRIRKNNDHEDDGA